APRPVESRNASSVRSRTNAPWVPHTANSTASVRRVALLTSRAPLSARPRAPLIFISVICRYGASRAVIGFERRTPAPVHQLGGRRADVCGRTCRGYALDVLDNAISLIDADGELADVLSPEQVERAKRGALARISRLSPGVWDAAAAL